MMAYHIADDDDFIQPDEDEFDEDQEHDDEDFIIGDDEDFGTPPRDGAEFAHQLAEIERSFDEPGDQTTILWDRASVPNRALFPRGGWPCSE